MAESIANTRFYEFGRYRIDAAQRVLLSDGEPVNLPPRVFDTLLALVLKNNLIVERDQLMTEVWADTFVEEGNLSVNISALRKTLGKMDDGGEFIETVPRRGYRFRSPVVELSNEDSLVATRRIRTVIRTTVEESEPDEGPLMLPAGQPSIWRSKLVIAIVALLVFSVGSAVYLYYVNRKTALQAMQIIRLSDTSQAVEAAVSPDGEFVVFIKWENGKESVWLKQTSAASSIQIAPPTEDLRYASPAFSPDGSHIYYLKAPPKEGRATLFQIPKLGGNERKLAGDISLHDSRSNFSLSPDGKQVAFIRLDESFNRSLVITDLDGSNERNLISRKLPEFLTGAAWSPDGETIACFAGKFGGKGFGGEKTVVLINVKDAAEKPISDKQWAQVVGLAWLSDTRGLILSAAEKPGLVQLWRVSNSDGALRRITNDLSDYAAPSLAARSSTIAAVQTNQNSNIWVVSPDQKENGEKQLTSGNGGKDGSLGLSLTPDGSVVFTSQASGNSEIWIVNSDGSSNKQLTIGDGTKTFPSVSHDGRYVVFASDRSGETGIWRIDIDGGNPVQLTTGSMPSFSPDGKWVFFYRIGSLWKIPAEGGGEPVQIKGREKDLTTAPVVSPDNSMIACNYLVGEPNAQFRIGVLPIEGGEPLKIFDTFTFAIKMLRWMPDSRAVSFTDTRDGVSNVFSHSLDSEKALPVTNFKSGNILNFGWSSDGKTLALARGNTTKDVVLISNFR